MKLTERKRVQLRNSVYMHKGVQISDLWSESYMHEVLIQVGFEPTIPVFEREKTVHALERAATVIGHEYTSLCLNASVNWKREHVKWLKSEYVPFSN
jgi:hypothetical protein